QMLLALPFTHRFESNPSFWPLESGDFDVLANYPGAEGTNEVVLNHGPESGPLFFFIITIHSGFLDQRMQTLWIGALLFAHFSLRCLRMWKSGLGILWNLHSRGDKGRKRCLRLGGRFRPEQWGQDVRQG